MGRPLDAPIEIAPRVLAEEWQELNLEDPASPDWREAIAIFEKRIRGRFLRPVEHIQHLPFSGFAIMALDCLLIETLQQFKEGVHCTPAGKVGEYFKRFLTDPDLGLGMHFDEDLAKSFYKLIRSGILHQAEIKGKSRIRVGLDTVVQRAPDGKGLVIDRRQFHQALVGVFERYIQRLQDPNEEELRRNFKCKMDAIVKEVLE